MEERVFANVQGTLKNFDACFGSELIDRNAS
jgi:hypothetical protein